MSVITLWNINSSEFSLENVFVFVGRKLIAQNAKSLSESGLCRYRGENGRCCAVGHLIPDENYNEHMEGQLVEVLINMYNVEIDKEKMSLLTKLQDLHDIFEPSKWLEKLEEIASEYGFDMSGIYIEYLKREKYDVEIVVNWLSNDMIFGAKITATSEFGEYDLPKLFRDLHYPEAYSTMLRNVINTEPNSVEVQRLLGNLMVTIIRR